MGWSELVDTLRDNFDRKYSENVAKGLYDQRDVDRIKNDFRFARTFIRGRERLEEGADLIHSSLAFKKEYNVHDATEEKFDIELRQLGALYFRNRDLNGSRILWLKVQLHRKDATADYIRQEKLGFAHALEKALNEDPLKQVVVVLDMSNCGLVNMDIDFVKFIITCFKVYYPTFLEYMLVYDMPWIFNAAWKIIKAWLSAEAAAKMKFVTKSNVQTYIGPDSLPVHMGGTDDFKYRYYPGISLERLYPVEEKQDEKKVTFEPAEPTVAEVKNESIPKQSINNNSTAITDLPPSRSQVVRSNTSNGSNNSIRRRHTNSNNNSVENFPRDTNVDRRPSSSSIFVGRFLSIRPSENLTFMAAAEGDCYDVITLSNTLPLPVAFKVKTTSPEKYRVRPSSGVVKPGKTEEVFVYLVEDHKLSATAKDKFLVMATEVSGPNLEDTAKLWKDVSKDSIMEHRLKCIVDTNPIKKVESNRPSVLLPAEPIPPSGLDEKVIRLEAQNQYMRKQLNLLIALQVSTAVFFLCIIFSYSCFGEDLFTRFLSLPFGFCSDKYGRKC